MSQQAGMTRGRAMIQRLPVRTNVQPVPPAEQNQLYMERVHRATANQPHLFRRFLVIMRTIRRERVPTKSQILALIRTLSHNVRLVLEFREFLPDGYTLEYLQTRYFRLEDPNGNVTYVRSR